LDPDVIHNSTSEPILHWYQPYLQVDPVTGLLTNYSDATTGKGAGAPFVAPQPPAGQTHRYIAMLFEQPARFQLSNCYSGIFPPTVDAREGFDLVSFVHANGLTEPVAATYWTVNVPTSVKRLRICSSS
jgi:hypothetical protein